MEKRKPEPDRIRVERVREGQDGFSERVRVDRINPPIRTSDELESIKKTVSSLSSWDRVQLTFGQAFGPVDEIEDLEPQSDVDTVTKGKTLEAIVDEVHINTEGAKKIRDEWDIELLLLRGTEDDDWDLRSLTGIGGSEAPWHVYTYPYNRETGECQPDNAVCSGWILDIERL